MPRYELLTDELLDEILRSRKPEDFLSAAYDDQPDLSAFLECKRCERQLSKAQIIRASHINETHGYQLFTGERGAGRNTALAVAFAMGLDLRDTQRLLMLAGAGALYYKNRRDAIITFCIERGYGLDRCDEELYRFGEETISDPGNK